MNQPDLAELERLLPDAQSMTLDEFSDATPEERIAATGRVKRARDKLFAALPALIECAKALERIDKFVSDYKAPWGSWKTAWWEGEVSDDAAFSDDNALMHIANIARAARGGSHGQG